MKKTLFLKKALLVSLLASSCVLPTSAANTHADTTQTSIEQPKKDKDTVVADIKRSLAQPAIVVKSLNQLASLDKKHTHVALPLDVLKRVTPQHLKSFHGKDILILPDRQQKPMPLTHDEVEKITAIPARTFDVTKLPPIERTPLIAKYVTEMNRNMSLNRSIEIPQSAPTPPAIIAQEQDINNVVNENNPAMMNANTLRSNLTTQMQEITQHEAIMWQEGLRLSHPTP